MKKGIKLACKILSVFLSVLLVIQIAPMQIIADAYHEATVDENTENTLGVSLDDIDTTEPEAEILAEETSKREQYVKHFRMSDGSYRATQYEVPVHFIQDGEWTDYDNTLVEVDADTEDGETASNKDLTNTLADYSVRLSKKTNGKKFVRIEKDGYKLSWYYTKANKVTAQITEITDDGDETTLEKLSSQVVYKNVYKDTDFEYIVGSEGLKENIILKSGNTQTEFVAEYKANGLTPVQIDDQTIELQTKDGTVIYTINAPYVTDADYEFSDGVILTLSNVKNNNFTVTITLDEDWLNDSERAYPVIVDPVIKTEQIASDMASAFVGSLYPTRNYYTYGLSHNGADSGSMYVGNISGYGQTESYLKFSNLPTLGVADKVVNAVGFVYMYKCENGMQVDIKRITSSWTTESVTWNTKPTIAPTITDYKYISAGANNMAFNFEITDFVRGWYSGEYANYGVSFSTTKTSSAKVWMLNSLFNEGGRDDARPILYVDYRNMSGYEDYWSYTGVSAGRNGAVSINNYNGNAVFTQPITMGDGGNLMPVSLSLVYNSNGLYYLDANKIFSYMGGKMQTNFHIYLKAESGDLAKDGYKYYLNDADGTKHWFCFEKDTNGKFKNTAKDEDGLGYTLDVITVGSDSVCNNAKFRITDKNDTKMYFNTSGNLIQITDSTGNSAKVIYATVNNKPRINYIEDGAGRKYTFNYNYSNNSNLCTSITDPAGRTTTFNYSAMTMISVRFPDGKTVSLSYNDDFLTTVGAIDGTRAKIAYDSTSQKRVSNINWGTSDSNLLESYSFAYKQNETTITERVSAEESRTYTYQFNNFGQTTGIVSNKDGNAQYFEYTAPTEKNSPNANKLLSQSKVINSVTNYAINPGFVNNLTGYSKAIANTTGNPTITVDTTKGHLTKNSLKIVKPTENVGYCSALQTISGLPTGTYTFSCYVNTEGATISGGGIYVGYKVLDANNNVLEQRKAEEKYSTNGWERMSITFDIVAGQKARLVIGTEGGTYNACGTMWFDDLQLEKSAGVSSYNLVDNSALTNGTTGWGTASKLVNISGLPGFTKGVYTDASTPSTKIGLTHRIYTTPGKKGDVFSFGSWVKGDSAPVNDLKKDDPHTPIFEIALHFYNSSNTWLKKKVIKLNDDLNTWQFVSGKVIAPVDYDHIGIEIDYSYNVNTVYATGAFCYKEEFGQTYTYDKNGNVVSSVDLANTESNFAYFGDQMAKMLNPSGSRYLYSYDEQNKLNYALSSDGQEYGFEYDDKGNVTNSEITARKPATQVEAGKEYIIVNAYSGKALDSGDKGTLSYDTVTNSYNPESIYQRWKLVETGTANVYKITSVAFPQYDLDIQGGSAEDGRVVQIYTPSSHACQKFKILKNNGENTYTIYTSISNYAKVFDAQYEDKNLEENQIVKQKTVVGSNLSESVKWYFYPVEETEDKTISTSATYTDNKNFVSTMTDQRGNVTTYNYNQNKGTLTSVTDAKNNTTNYVYNANTNALQSVTSGGMTNSYTYNNDRLTEINVNGSTRYKFLYDTFGRTTKTQIGNGTTYKDLSTLVYNNKGLLSKQTYGNQDYITFEYDNLDRLINKSYNGSNINRAQYFYGADGNITRTIDYSTNTDTKYVYDLAGRVVSIRDYRLEDLTYTPLKASVEYTYADKTNYLTGIKHYNKALGTQNIGYRYGNLANGEMPDVIYGVTWNGTEKVNYTYDSLGRLTNKNVNSVLNNNYSYVDVNSTKTTTLLSSLSTVAGTYSYTYDELGNITSINDGTYTTSYEYDDLNQLVRENDQKANRTYVYTYSNGNITSKKEYAYTTGDLGALQDTITWNYVDSTWGDLLTGFDGTSITYDEIGNPITYGNYTIDWNGRRLESINLNDTEVLSYEYNIDGQRVSKTYEGVTTEYFYNGSILAGEKTGNNVIIYMYDNNGDIFGFTYNGTEYYYIKNAQNDVVAIADASGNVVVRYYYNAWGEIIDCVDNTTFELSSINPITYRSYYNDNIAGMDMYYLNSRYYVSDWGRFASADGIYDTNTGVLSHNMFAYCNNNPVNMIDSEGTGPLWNLIKKAAKKIYKIITGKEYEKQDVAKTTFNTTKTIIESVDAYGDACNNARKDYITHIENVVNYNNNKDVELKTFNNTKLKLNPESYYAKRAYQGLYVYALGEGYDLKSMTWEDVQKHPKLEEELIGIYCIWDQATVNSIAVVYGVDWSVDQGSAIFFS